jgi:uncharacterized LabA/DUF88 family protein
MREVLRGARAAALFDVPYIYHSVRKYYPQAKVDYTKLMEYLEDDLDIDITRAASFILDTRDGNTAPGFNTFVEKLKSLGFDVILQKPRKTFDEDKPLKTDNSVAITTEAILAAPKNDVVILASGSADFVYLVDTLKTLQVKTLLLGIRATMSKELIASCHDVIELTPDLFMGAERKKAG